jgi:hypothetical protein
MEELAQSVGNEKMPGEFDWDAATDVDLNTNDSGPFALICQIDAQTIALLRNYLWRVSEPVNASFSQESNPVFLHPPTDTSAKK